MARREAEIIGNYLIGTSIQNCDIEKYILAISMVEFNFSTFENKIWEKMLKNKFYMTTIDAGLAILYPLSAIRHRIFIMLAILEASPNYTVYFLNKKFPNFYIIKIVLVGIRSVLTALIGVILLKIIKITCN